MSSSAPRCLVTLAAFVSLASLTGCEAGLRVKQIDAAQERPANVLLFFRVTGDGLSGVPGLQESAFNVKEDDHLIAPGVDRVIVNPDLRTTQTTMVLVDLGGRPSAEELEALSASASALFDKMGTSRRVALYALDGAPEPFALAPFGSSQDALKAAAAKIPNYKTRDPSLDLNGGYVSALHALKQATPPSAGPRIANLVLVVRGPDRASRLEQRGVSAEVKKTDIDVRRFAVAYGPDTEKADFGVFADGSVTRVASSDALREAASKIGDALDERGRSFYLLSYCTAARGGEHRVKVSVERERSDEKGHVSVDRGSLNYAFHADGFGPGCTPNVPDGWKSGDAVAGRDHVSLATTDSAKVDARRRQRGRKSALEAVARGRDSRSLRVDFSDGKARGAWPPLLWAPPIVRPRGARPIGRRGAESRRDRVYRAGRRLGLRFGERGRRGSTCQAGCCCHFVTDPEGSSTCAPCLACSDTAYLDPSFAPSACPDGGALASEDAGLAVITDAGSAAIGVPSPASSNGGCSSARTAPPDAALVLGSVTLIAFAFRRSRGLTRLPRRGGR